MPDLETYLKPSGLIPIHPVVLGPLMRKSVSLCIAMPGVGKSTWAQAAAIAIRHERPDIIGETAHTPLWPGHVVLMAAEDPKRIVHAKLGTLEDHHGLTAPPKHGVSTVSMAGKKLFRLGDRDEVEFVGLSILEEIAELRRQHDIALIVVDTLSAALQGVNESNPEQMQYVMDVFQRLAEAAFCSVLLVHHANKVSVGKDDSLTLYSGRGSSVIPASVRSSFTLANPDKKESALLTAAGETPKSWVRLNIVKSSYTDPTTWDQRWFKFEPKVLSAYDPRDQSQHAMSIGILVPKSAPTSLAVIGAFATTRQSWDKLKGALKQGPVYGLTRSYKGKLTAKDVTGLTEDQTNSMLEELVKAGIISMPNLRTKEILWDGVIDLPPETDEAEDAIEDAIGV